VESGRELQLAAPLLETFPLMTFPFGGVLLLEGPAIAPL
jgi:hypothetical protein